MKGTIATISSFLCVLLSAAQTEAVVAPVKMNVLYIGVENPLDIAVPGVASKDVSATISENAVLEKVSDGHFIAKPMSVGKCVVTVYAKGKPVSSTDFRAKRIPDPTVTVGGNLLGGHAQNQILSASVGIIVRSGHEYDFNFKVRSFGLTRQSANNMVQKAETLGPMFSTQMKEIINSSKPGDIIWIDEAVVVGPDLQPRRLPSIAFTIL
jgi:hypothetical protein